MPRKIEAAVSGQSLDPQHLFRTLAGRRGIVLAVSGGSDSTALMWLASEWRERPPLLVVTVDHGLRRESADEARVVAQNAATLGLPCRIMTVSREPSGNMQDWARRVRYRCLVDAAGEAGFDTIATAHHQDDQAETFLLRLARGSGVYGLASMAGEGMLDGIMLGRPLLGVPRDTLVAIAAHTGLPISADPGNLDPKFDRVKMRRLMPILAEHGLPAARLTETAARLRRAAGALDHYAGLLIKERFTADSLGVVRGDAAAFRDAPEEVALRALALILRAVGGADYTPRLENIEALRAAVLDAGVAGSLKRTLHGAVAEVSNGRFTSHREWGRDGPARVPATAGSALVWDKRFHITVPPMAGELQIGPLGRSEVAFARPGVDRYALKTLPGLFQNGTLVAMPEGVRGADSGGIPGQLDVKCLVEKRLSAGPAG